MSPEIEALLVLQDRDQKIRALRLEQKNLPRDLKAVEDKLTAARVRLESARQRARENEVDRPAGSKAKSAPSKRPSPASAFSNRPPGKTTNTRR